MSIGAVGSKPFPLQVAVPKGAAVKAAALKAAAAAAARKRTHAKPGVTSKPVAAEAVKTGISVYA